MGGSTSKSSRNISAARVDWAEKINSLIGSLAVLRASTSSSLFISLTTTCMLLESMSTISSKVNISSRICSAKSGLDSSMVARIRVSVDLSSELSISATASMPPTFDVPMAPEACISRESTSSISETTPGWMLSRMAIRYTTSA